MEKKEKIEELLKKHDWFFEYSDDSKVYTRGQNERITLEECLGKMPKREANELWNKYCPEMLKRKER